MDSKTWTAGDSNPPGTGSYTRPGTMPPPAPRVSGDPTHQRWVTRHHSPRCLHYGGTETVISIFRLPKRMVIANTVFIGAIGTTSLHL